MIPLASMLTVLCLSHPALPQPVPPNPAIDMPGFLRVSEEVSRYRETRRISEADFIRMSREPGTIVLDARSQDTFDLLHVKGAIHLDYTDFGAGTLARTIPDKSTRILIYCNNNFLHSPVAFFSKMPTQSLNLSTFVALYDYGYRNVYELAPQIDVRHARLDFESRWAEMLPGGVGIR